MKGYPITETERDWILDHGGHGEQVR
jgi:hypothetical protein